MSGGLPRLFAEDIADAVITEDLLKLLAYEQQGRRVSYRRRNDSETSAASCLSLAFRLLYQCLLRSSHHCDSRRHSLRFGGSGCLRRGGKGRKHCDWYLALRPDR